MKLKKLKVKKISDKHKHRKIKRGGKPKINKNLLSGNNSVALIY